MSRRGEPGIRGVQPLYEPHQEPSVTPETRDWWDEAACADVDIKVFFVEKGDNIRKAKAICAECPVRRTCLEEALKFEEGSIRYSSGVFGGLSAHERVRLRASRRRSA